MRVTPTVGSDTWQPVGQGSWGNASRASGRRSKPLRKSQTQTQAWGAGRGRAGLLWEMPGVDLALLTM